MSDDFREQYNALATALTPARKCSRCGQGAGGCCTIWVTITLAGETKTLHQACHLANHIDEIERRLAQLERKA